ncbi:MAG: hypothetical protein II265_08615 [Clostridia bacterium]|nr:hypothetical protein [Clostridia bacterium]
MAKKPIIKADANGLTPEQKAEQVARFFTQKRESYFQLILANLVQGAARTGNEINIRLLVVAALDGADYAIEKLFPLPSGEKKEGE